MASAGQPAGLTDSDILIDASHHLPDAVAFLAAQRAARAITISIISAMELIVGCRNKAELTRVRQFLQQVSIVPIGPSASQTAYQLMDSYFLSHGLLIADSLIAATAMERGLTLYTKNTRHLQMIPRLTAVRPY